MDFDSCQSFDIDTTYLSSGVMAWWHVGGATITPKVLNKYALYFLINKNRLHKYNALQQI